MNTTLEKQKALRQKWIAALRSGKYKQGKNALACKRNDGKMHYCCLGVACEIFNKEYPNILKIEEGQFRRIYDKETSYLPQKIQEALGLVSRKGSFKKKMYGNIVFDTLTELNDQGEFFNKIADIIESKPTGLFVESIKEN